MQYAITKLLSDVMALSGETPRRRESLAAIEVPWTSDSLAMRIEALLPICGKEVLLEAAPHSLGGGESTTPAFTCRLMPCGLYAVDLRLPADTVRIVSLTLPGWKREVTRVIKSDSAEWTRQWSREAAIAGCPEKPMAYLGASEAGIMLRSLGIERPIAVSEGAGGAVAASPRVVIWRVPGVDGEGNFCFPEGLYSELTVRIMHNS